MRKEIIYTLRQNPWPPPTTEPNFDGWRVADLIAAMHRIASEGVTIKLEPKKEPEPPANEEEPAHYFGFCDVCEHTHAFCTCED